MDLASKTTRSGGIAEESMSRTLAVLRKADRLNAKAHVTWTITEASALGKCCALDLSWKPKRRPAPSSEDLEQLSSI